MSVFMTVRRKIEFNKRPIKQVVMVVIQVRTQRHISRTVEMPSFFIARKRSILQN